MQVLDFTNKEFHEIPEQDNPAFDNQECYMVCRSSENTMIKKFVVIHIIPIENPKENETVTRIAEFWDSANAMNFTEAYVSSPSYGVPQNGI